MNVSDWNNDEILRLICAKGRISQKILLEKYAQKYNTEIPQSTFSNKIRRNSLKIEELQKICTLLGYSIIIKKNED